MLRHRLRSASLFVLLAASLVHSGMSLRAAATAATVVVKPSAMNGWFFYDDATNALGGPASLVAGPVGAPAGSGSVRLGPLTATSGTNGMAAIATVNYVGTPLTSLTSLSYASFQPGPTLAPALQFDIKYRPTDSAYGGRLVFEPYQNGAVTVGSGWQTWFPLAGKWWASKTSAAGSNGLCPQSSPCTWNDILTAFPSAQISGALLLKAGSNWLGFDGNADALTVGVNGADTTFDFEPETGCTTDCYVNASTGNDAFGGDTPSSAKKTIGAALAQVLTGGTVHVAGGTYTGAVSITRSVTIAGAMAGIDPRPGRSGTETAIAGLVTINASAVTIDGVSISNSGAGSLQGVLVKTAGTGAHITNTIIGHLAATGTNNTAHAIYLENGPDNVTIDHNAISAISAAAASASGVLIGDSLSTNPSTGISIHDNTIAGVSSGTKGAYGVIVNNGANVVGPTRGYTQVTIADNTISGLTGGTTIGATTGWAHAIGLEADTPGAVVTGNAISNVIDQNPLPLPDAIAVYFEANGGFASSTVSNNTFDGVAFGVSLSTAMLQAQLPGAVVASCNWWGDASGPNLLTVSGLNVVQNGPGTGAYTSAQVSFHPWKVAPNGPCTGGIPVCQVGSYLASPNDLTCTFASPGHYVDQPGATSETACPIGTFSAIAGAAQCQLATPGTFVDTTGAVSATACAPGSYQPSAGASTCILADAGYAVPFSGSAVQQACPVGTFSNQPGATSCQAASVCHAGQYVAVPASGVNDAICADAPAGSYTDTDNQLAPTACALGTFQPNSGQTSCLIAPIGSHVSTTGATVAPPCAPGTYSDHTGAVLCTASPAGSFAAGPGGGPGATHATLCPAGEHQPNTGQSHCLTAQPGTFSPLPGAVQAQVCPLGTYQPQAGQTSCLAADPGFFVGVTGAAAQNACPVGTFSNAAGAASCNAATVCSVGQYQVSPATSTHDATCAAVTVCHAGQYVATPATATSDAVCAFTPAGSYTNTDNAPAPVSCPIGYYQPADGANQCLPAQPGTFVSSTGASAATPCTPGSYQDGTAAASCKPAQPGSFVSTAGAAVAQTCPIGTFSDHAGATICTQAPAGTFVAIAGAAAAQSCPIGFYQPNAGQSSCLPAQPGSFVSSTGAATAQLCPAGSYQDQSAAASCKPSPAGFYVPTAGAAFATACPVGTTSGVGATSCTPVAPPTFSNVPANITTTATSAAGASVTYVKPTARDFNSVSVPVSCAPASGATFPIGTTTVTCTATDSYTRTATASFTVTVNDVTTPGSMTGEGVVKNGDDRYHFDFTVREQASGERGRFSLEINYAKRVVLDNRGRPQTVTPQDATFRSTGVTFVTFSDDPTIRPGRAPRPQVDTVLFTGTGVWNGRAGYTYEVRAQDSGEPGRHRESISIVIRDGAGAIVAQASGDLAGGNVQSGRIRH